ncbi:MAG: TetR family transcriptional regulator [Desulfobacterales bacterium]|nr:TetR family transcriptional regulator [Desulfobacterales bacterium]
MKISELEAITGIPRSTIHHYVNLGLLHRPEKSGKTMADYDHSHVKRLEAIQRIKLEYLKTVKTSRIPIDFIKHRLTESYSLAKPAAVKTKTRSGGNSKKGQQKKEDIIEATLRLYAHRGYYLTKIRDITKALGISSPTFYRYFKDKRELFVETIEYVVKNFKNEIQAALKGEKDLSRRSMIMFTTFYAHYPKIGEILNQLRSGVIIGDPWAKDRLLRLNREMMGDLIKELQGAIKNGIVRPIDPVLLSHFTLAIDEVAIHLASMDDTYSIDDVMYFVGDMLNNAFLTEKGKQIFNIFYKSRKPEKP